jgi:hypothetical protein
MTNPTGACCLCGGEYERFGNNPHPLVNVDEDNPRCCDACNEVVTEARIDPGRIIAEIKRGRQALAHTGTVIGVICAVRGPELWAEKQTQLAKLRDGS